MVATKTMTAIKDATVKNVRPAILHHHGGNRNLITIRKRISRYVANTKNLAVYNAIKVICTRIKRAQNA